MSAYVIYIIWVIKLFQLLLQDMFFHRLIIISIYSEIYTFINCHYYIGTNVMVKWLKYRLKRNSSIKTKSQLVPKLLHKWTVCFLSFLKACTTCYLFIWRLDHLDDLKFNLNPTICTLNQSQVSTSLKTIGFISSLGRDDTFCHATFEF